MEISLYNVTKITADAPHKSGSSTFRTIHIFDKDAGDIELSLFSDDWKKLLIKTDNG